MKIGDFVKAKPGTHLKSGELIEHWAGKIGEIDQKNNTCWLLLDAPTINSLEDAFLQEYAVEAGYELFEFELPLHDLELAPRRDTDEELRSAIEHLSERTVKMENDQEMEREQTADQQIESFEESPYFQSLNAYQQEKCGFILDTFLGYMFDYEGVDFKEWEPRHIESVCLDLVPAKISSEQELFENYADVLIPFLQFLDDNNHLSDAPALIKKVESIREEIPKAASNPRNWGIAKSILMSQLNEEGEPTEEKMMDFLNSPFTPFPSKQEPIQKDPLDKIGRNEKIIVQYTDGRVVENVKFKKVEKDLKAGLCTRILP